MARTDKANAKTDAELEHMYWLVKSRLAVQQLMVDLLFFLTKNERVLQSGRDRLIFGHLVAIAFSLWRAAFLAEKKRDWDLVNVDLALALEKLIEDNSFLYPDEKNFGSWTVTYFLNNARLRMFHAIERHVPELKQHPEYPSLLSAIDEGFDRNAVPIWNDLMRMTLLMFDALKTRVNGINPPGHRAE